MDGPWYFPHGDHLAYLEAYAEDFDIHSMVRYNTRVEKIDRVYADGLQQTWKVWSKSLTFDRSEHESVTATATWDVEVNHLQNSPVHPLSWQTFDAVVCATGHHK
jgi:cation diffusion facilitator CzcD-associated flavoprotein CzcO